jgi:hypothetical protein
MRVECIEESVVIDIPNHLLVELKYDFSLDDIAIVAELIGPVFHKYGWNMYDNNTFIASSEI